MERDTAVSPVIGVLLMLTLTLIVAAIVNSYAGGLVETETKAPAVTLQASYYHDEKNQNEALKIRHISGDPIPTSSVKLFIRPSESLGKEAPQKVSLIEKSLITNISDSSLTWESGINAFRPGDLAVITRDHVNETQKDENSKYWLSNSSNLGRTFFLEVYYKNSLISKNEVLIE